MSAFEHRDLTESLKLILVWKRKTGVSQPHCDIFLQKVKRVSMGLKTSLAAHDLGLSSRLLHTVESVDHKIRGEW